MKLHLPGTSKMFVAICTFALLSTVSKAQFSDYKPYPITVSPHESKDSVRGHFWGYMFGSYYDKIHADSSLRGNTQYSQIPKGGNAFSLQRLYLGYDYFFNKKYSVHAIIAHEENADDAYTQKIVIDPELNRSFYLKYAYMECDDIFKGSTLTLGVIPTPGFGITEEPFWGYRPIDRTIMDMKAITGSNDMGVNLGGRLWSKKDDSGNENACVGYNFMVGNGTGSVPDNFAILAVYTIWKKYYGDLYVRMLHDKLVLDLYGDGRTLELNPFHSSIITGRAFLGYKTKKFNIGVEYFKQTQHNMLMEMSGPGVPALGDTIDNIQSGFSIMAAAVLMNNKKTGDAELSAYARYDGYNPDVTYNPNVLYNGMQVAGISYFLANPITESYFVVGLDYAPIKQIHIMPNIWYDGITSRDNNLTALQKHDYDLVPRITFYYQFFKN